MEISRRCIKRVAKDLESCAPEISRKLTHLLPGQMNVSLDVDLEGIIVSKAHNHHHANANEATSEHTLRRPQSRHVSIFENDGTRTLEFECSVASSQNKLDSQEHEDGRREKGSSSELRGLSTRHKHSKHTTASAATYSHSLGCLTAIYLLNSGGTEMGLQVNVAKGKERVARASVVKE